MPALDRFVLREAVRMIAGRGDRPGAPVVSAFDVSTHVFNGAAEYR